MANASREPIFYVGGNKGGSGKSCFAAMLMDNFLAQSLGDPEPRAYKKEDGKGNVGSVAGGSSLGSDWDDDFEMDDSNAGYKG
jgi:hypothetical protein